MYGAHYEEPSVKTVSPEHFDEEVDKMREVC